MKMKMLNSRCGRETRVKHRWAAWRRAGLVVAALGMMLHGGAARAGEEGLAVVLEPKVEGALGGDEKGHLEAAVVDALRGAQLQVVPGADREAILDGEPELRGCRTDECQDRIGRLLSAQTVVTWELKRSGGGGAPAPVVPSTPASPAGKGKGGKNGGPKAAPGEPPPAPLLTDEKGSWQFTVSVFNVAIGAVGDKESAECSRCNVLQARTLLGELVKKAVLLDAARARGTIEVTSTPNADVAVDGRKLGFTPYKRPAFAGKHEITVSRTGYKSHHETINVEEGRKKAVQVTLKQGSDQEIRTVRGPRPVWRIAVGAAAIGGAALMIGFGGSALSVNGKCVEGTEPDGPCPTTPVANMMVETRRFATTGLGAGLVSVGAAMAVAGAVLIALPGEKRVEIGAGPLGIGGTGLRLAGSF